MRGTVRERLEAKYTITANGCWVWTGAHGQFGHGMMKVDGRNVGAHRVSYELNVGPIPEGLEIDHLCRNPPCVNPAHLEPVTHRENVARGVAWEWNRSKTHCRNGHPYDEANTYHIGSERQCRTCKREAGHRVDLKRRSTHCPQGHEYTPENIMLVGKRQLRRCRTCGWPPKHLKRRLESA